MNDNFVLVIFGITSNLAQIKLIPALYDLFEKKLLPKNTTIVGIARSPKTKAEITDFFHQVLHSQNKHHKHLINNKIYNQLIKSIYYIDGKIEDPLLYRKLSSFLHSLNDSKKSSQNIIYYLATYPELYSQIFIHLQKQKLNKSAEGWVRIMIEKPIGNDYNSAKKLDNLLLKYFTEEQIYRLDHYLGKETLQNILTFRFGNGIFEPLINNRFIDHIQITAAEDFGVGQRGAYYDNVGALKDVGQNHLLQMLTFVTMNAPVEFSNNAVTKERIKILKNLKPKDLILGKYQGYENEENINPQSNIDTFFAYKLFINNKRFRGVPIYIRGGKKLKLTAAEISIVFKTPQLRLFKHLKLGISPTVLIFRIQPNEGIVLKILTKKPGYKVELEENYLQFCYKLDNQSHYLPDPYERLLMDAINGDQTFFNDSKEVEASWKFIDKLLENKPKIINYKPGTWGPKIANRLLQDDGRLWIEPSLDFCKI